MHLAAEQIETTAAVCETQSGRSTGQWLAKIEERER